MSDSKTPLSTRQLTGVLVILALVVVAIVYLSKMWTYVFKQERHASDS